MSSAARNILRHAMPLIPAHGFTRECLSNAAASVTGAQSFGDTEVTALFGRGDEAKKTFIRAWLKEGLHDMATTHPNVAIAEPSGSAKPSNLEHLLRRRLMYNENVLRHLPEAAALLAATPVPLLLDPSPLAEHASAIADEARHLSGDVSRGTQWYARRGTLALAYTAAELHQMQSPETAASFLSRLLHEAKYMEDAVESIGQFAGNILDSWKGIIKSRGIV